MEADSHPAGAVTILDVGDTRKSPWMSIPATERLHRRRWTCCLSVGLFTRPLAFEFIMRRCRRPWLLVWLPSRSLEVAVDRERLKHVLLALDAVMLEVETQEDEWRGLLSVLVSHKSWTISVALMISNLQGDVGEVVRCQRLDIFVYPVHPAESRHSMDRGSRGRNRLSRPTSAVVKSNQITAAFSEAQVLPHAKINVVDHVR
ncbi:hypothetical protein OH76DRAFT_1405845 [Lentinus brumalis]|uniref:Uncharacterized protein n=1 Tax=Lentinus brumalis TaxID=2498619 RepID=A0A371D4P8_9APHY|nr:hypothetical protein OH76DRAFT_1405845 [Polyporus brumalis]